MNDFILIKLQHFHFEHYDQVQINDFDLRKVSTIEDIRGLKLPDNFLRAVGTVFVTDLAAHPFLTKEVAFSSREDVFEKLEKELDYIDYIAKALWLIKDNSCNILQSAAHWESGSPSFSLPLWQSGVYSTAAGKHKDVTFTNDELIRLADLIDNLRSLQSVKVSDEFRKEKGIYGIKSGYSHQALHYVSYNAYNRIERAMGFISQARSSSDIGRKISYYVLILECMFATTGTGELLHKVSERCANYIGTDAADKLAIFKKIKVLYDIRSKYVHGQPLGKLFDEGKDPSPISIEADELVRKVFVKAIMEDGEKFLWKNDPFEDWVNSMIFK